MENVIDGITNQFGADGHMTGEVFVLEARGLSCGHDGVAVAAATSFGVRAGEAVLLLGPSGVGKTTLLLTLAGLISPVSGSVTLEGQRYDDRPARQRDQLRGRRIGLVFQDVHGVGGLSVVDNVVLGAFAVGVRQDRAAARGLLDQVGLSPLASRRFETLSRGEAQRVALARALLLRPAVILADEPTASLDDANTERVADLLIGASRKTGAALVITTHDQRLKRHIGRVVNLDPAT